MRIHILDSDTIAKIAAGEVIERPASVVRELVDNAIDAGASTITVDIHGGGSELIAVSDDGHGMARADLVLAVERHATSKIASGEDLFAVSTLGFRGEALASIGAVSKLTITTRTKAAVEGHRLTVVGGEKGEVEPAASPVGTRVEVKDLFFNTPARLKFLKKPATEMAAITDAVSRLALAWPQVRFRLSHNGKPVLRTPGSGSLQEAVAAVAGLELVEDLLTCHHQQDGYQVAGLVASPRHHRSSRNLQFVTVNSRPVAARVVASAVEKAFHSLVPVNRYPVFFLDIRVPAGQVDVNVHPAKREVKFAEPNTVFRLVYQACLDALAPAPGEGRGQDLTPPPVAAGEGQGVAPPPRFTQLTLSPVLDQGENKFQVLGQVFSTYIVVATPSELRLVDQHAAQERIMYERFLTQIQGGKRPAQVVIPVELTLPGRLRQFVEAYLPKLNQLGFKIDLRPEGIIVREVPILFKRVLGQQDVLEILQHLEEHDHQCYNLEDYSQAALMMLACKGAIKANQRLDSGESHQLLLELERCRNNTTCPHGRPIWVAFDKGHLEKLFARR